MNTKHTTLVTHLLFKLYHYLYIKGIYMDIFSKIDIKYNLFRILLFFLKLLI